MSGAEESRPPPPIGSYLRENAGLEFDRVSFFSDAVYAIAMTLLVVDLKVPEGADVGSPAALSLAVWRIWPDIFAFFLGFVVIGRYWLAHHLFFWSLRSIDQRMISVNLIYLAFVAFSPFPVSLISDFENNPLSFGLFALCMAAISGLETVMFLQAASRGHTRMPLTPGMVRFGLIASGMPVVVMLLSIPIGLVNPSLGLASWLLMIPIGAWTRRSAPTGLRDPLRPD